MFQSYALYPHMSVRKNLSFGLETMRAPRDEIRRRVAHAAEILQIDELLERRPGQLSGGQRQRVAIGRAIVREPRIFLFDEPLSNLDAELRVQMRVEIKKLHQRLGVTMIFVTHDQVEAMTLADRIVVLRSGVIEQVGTPLDLYNKPANLFVAGFIGSPRMNFLEGEVAGVSGDALTVRGKSGAPFKLPVNGARPETGPVTIGIRPQHLRIVDPGAGGLSGEVQIAEHLGGETFLYVALPSEETLVVEVPGQVTARHRRARRHRFRAGRAPPLLRRRQGYCLGGNRLLRADDRHVYRAPQFKADGLVEANRRRVCCEGVKIGHLAAFEDAMRHENRE